MAENEKQAAPAENRSEKGGESSEKRSMSTATVAESQQGIAGAEKTWTNEGSLNRLHEGLTGLNAQRGADGRITVDNPNPYPALRGDGLSAQPDSAVRTPDNAVVKDANGLIKTDGRVDMPAKKPDGMSDQDFENMRTQVEALNAHLNDPRAQLTDRQRQDMERSAEQMLSNKNPDGSERRPPLDPKEATKVLEQANRMFDKQDVITANGFTVQDRNLAVTAMVHDVANPNHANQGLNNTCNVSAAAKAEMMTSPGAQAQRYVDMFANESNRDANGMYVNFPDGNGGTQRVYYDRNSIVPDKEAKHAADNIGSGTRDAYMQGLNHLYVNSVTQQRGEYYTDGKPEFEGDTGERLHRGGFNGEVRRDQNGRIETSPAMVAEDVQAVLNKIGAGQMAADYTRFGVSANNGGVLRVEGGNRESLDAAWQANGGRPMVIAVDTNSAMFNSATNVGGKTEGGGHVVTLVDQRVNPETGKTEYLLQNSWGDKYNGWVAGDAIASAMNPRAAGGDRSGIVPPAGRGGDESNPNWGEQPYHRPGKDSSQTSGDGRSYDQEGAPKRDSSGIKTDGDRQAEMDYRKKLAEEEEQRLRQEQQKKDKEEQERLEREARDHKLKDEEQQRKEFDERMRRMRGGSDQQ